MESLLVQSESLAEYVGIDNCRKIDLEHLENLCKDVDNSILVSIQFANNEIGTVQEIKEIAKIVLIFTAQ